MPSPVMRWPKLDIYTTIRIIRCRWIMICRPVRHPHRRRRRCRCAMAWAWLWCMAIRLAGVPLLVTTTTWQLSRTTITMASAAVQCWSTAITTPTAATTTIMAACVAITDIRLNRAAPWAAPSRSSRAGILSCITSTRADEELDHIVLL